MPNDDDLIVIGPITPKPFDMPQSFLRAGGIFEAIHTVKETSLDDQVAAAMLKKQQALQAYLNRDPLAHEKMMLRLTTPKPLQEFIKDGLAEEMRKHRGKKRIRKKKAKRALKMIWAAVQMARVLTRRMDYAAVGRKTFLVEPLPAGALPIYDMGLRPIAEVVCGEE